MEGVLGAQHNASGLKYRREDYKRDILRGALDRNEQGGFIFLLDLSQANQSSANYTLYYDEKAF